MLTCHQDGSATIAHLALSGPACVLALLVDLEVELCDKGHKLLGAALGVVAGKVVVVKVL